MPTGDCRGRQEPHSGCVALPLRSFQPPRAARGLRDIIAARLTQPARLATREEIRLAAVTRCSFQTVTAADRGRDCRSPPERPARHRLSSLFHLTPDLGARRSPTGPSNWWSSSKSTDAGRRRLVSCRSCSSFILSRSAAAVQTSIIRLSGTATIYEVKHDQSASRRRWSQTGAVQYLHPGGSHSRLQHGPTRPMANQQPPMRAVPDDVDDMSVNETILASLSDRRAQLVEPLFDRFRPSKASAFRYESVMLEMT